MKSPAAPMMLLLAGCAAVSPDSPFFRISDEALAAESDAALCDIYASSGDSRAYQEIQRRDLLTDDEWKLAPYKQINLGMSEIAVICSWGRPSDVNRSVGSWGVHEQWIYCSRDAWGQRQSYPCLATTYVYFENGIVSGWQD